MKLVKINAYDYQDLTDKAKNNVLYWLDEFPLEYELEDGSMAYEYFSDLTDENYIIDHCEMNSYVFDINGRPIHHLIESENVNV